MIPDTLPNRWWRSVVLPVFAPLALGAAMLSCSEFGTDADAAVAIEIDPIELPAIVVGDSLRDATGQVISLSARAFNSSNDVISSAPIRFYVLDTGIVTLDSITGRIFGRRPGQATVIASIGGLQSERITIRVTLRPDTLFGLDSLRRSMPFSLLGATNSGDLRVFLGHDSLTTTGADTSLAVPNYLVQFRIAAPTGDSASVSDTTRVVLTNEADRPSVVDTTDAQGIAARRLRLSAAVNVVPDSVVVEATATRPDNSPVPGSPVQFIVRIIRQP
ncbi:MAG: hypothetical protein ACR2G6_01410 [Gemmatimonadaceae bacterium]